MVGSVQGSAGSTAYVKSAQLGSGSSAPVSKRDFSSAPEGAEPPKKTRESEGNSREGLFTAKKTTELETRNDESTVKAEATRGSLLDIAV